jgi:multimeric flavodoxin WrbA
MPVERRAMTDAIEEAATGLGMQVAVLRLRDMDVKKCIGCFSCWVKTPGVCALNDDGRKLPEEWARADLVVYSTPVFLGSYSPRLKTQLDRLIPVLLPYFKKFDGETHHPQRYPKKKALVAFGLLKPGSEAEAGTFDQLVHRNALNMQARFCETLASDRELERSDATTILARAKEAVS